MQQIKADKDYEQAMQMVHHQNQKYIFNFLRQIDTKLDEIAYKKLNFESDYKTVNEKSKSYEIQVNPVI